MIHLTSQGEAPRADYDSYISLHPLATPYHRTAWLSAVERAYGHKGVWLVSTDKGRINGLLPLCVVKAPLGRAKLTSLPFCDLGGPLADNPGIADTLTQQARALLTKMGAASLELRLERSEIGAGTALEGCKVRMTCQLPPSADTLLSSYKPKLRSQIRKAEKNGLTARLSREASDIDAFYSVYSANMKRLGSPAHSKRWFQALQQEYAHNTVIGLVYKNDTPVGAGWLLLNGHTASIPWASTLAEYNSLSPNMLLYWQLIGHVADQGYTVFDFGRSTYGEGTYRFKKQWGAEPNLLDWQKWGKSGKPETQRAASGGIGRKVRPLVEQGWQWLPAGVTDVLGPRLRRYITL